MKTSDLVWQDTQHQDLLALVEELKNSPDAGMEILDKLTDYVAHHFTLEEKYMEVTQFTGAEKHIRAHRMFENKIMAMKKSQHILEQGLKDASFRLEITNFLNEWLIDHVMGLDKELEEFVLNSSIK